jgi:uncharacterized cupredoxin-like copper-binding protein
MSQSKTKRTAFRAFFSAVALFGLIAAAGAQRPEDGKAVSVRLTEYTIEMPQTLPPGPTTFAIRNDGQKSHSFKIEGPGIEEASPVIVRPHKNGTLEVTLQPGNYKVYCPIGSHAAKGMTMTLVVRAK